MELRRATRNDLPAIVELFRTSNDTSHDLAAVAEEKVFVSGWKNEVEPVVAADAGRIIGIAVRSAGSLRLIAVDRHRRRAGIGSLLLGEVEARARAEERFPTLRVAAEAGNYFVPGVPDEDAATRRFFQNRGFRETGERAVNLVVDLTALAHEDDRRIERVSEETAPEALAYVATFAGAWRHEAERALLNDPPTLFVLREERSIIGFSAHNANNRGLGWFGPAGVSPGQRSRGLGAILSRASFADLRAAGFRRSIVPWVSSISFYERVASARVSETFLPMEKNLLL